MLPSLKTTYDAKLQRTLEEIKKNPELLREVVDQKMVDDMDRALNKLTKILSAPELESLESFHLGLQKAHTELTNVLDFGDVRSWVQTILPKGFTALGRLAAFTNGLTRLLKQLPKIVNIVKGQMSSERRAEWNENQPMSDLLDTATANKLLSIIVKAMKPESSFFSLDMGLPYVNDKTAAAEILGLSYKQLVTFSQASQAIEQPIAIVQAKQLSQDIKDMTGQGEKEAEPGPEPIPPGAKEKLVIPAPTAAQSVAKATAPIVASQSTVKMPSPAEMEEELSNVYDDTLLKLWGESGFTDRMEKFKEKFIRNALQALEKKAFTKRISKSQKAPKQQD